MKKNYFVFLVLLSFLLSCSNDEYIKEKNKELNNKIIQLKCRKSVEVGALEYAYLVKKLRGKNDSIKFTYVYYKVSKKDEDVYVLVDNNIKYFEINIDQVMRFPYGGFTKTPMMKITKLCN